MTVAKVLERRAQIPPLVKITLIDIDQSALPSNHSGRFVVSLTFNSAELKRRQLTGFHKPIKHLHPQWDHQGGFTHSGLIDTLTLTSLCV